MDTRYKLCPTCKKPAKLDVLICTGCKHTFRTAFNTPTPEATVAYSVSPQPQAYADAEQPGEMVAPPKNNSDIFGYLLCLLSAIGMIILAVYQPFVYTHEVVITWMIFSVAVGQWAYSKGLSYVWGVGFAAAFSPIVGAIMVAATARNTEELERRQIATGIFRRCPNCAELTRTEARICKHCGQPTAV